MSNIHRRRIRANDLPKIVSHIGQLGSWYGADLGQQANQKVLKKLLIERAVESQIIEQSELNGGGTRLLGLGITAFLDLQTTLQLLETPPTIPLTDYLYQKEHDAECVFLRPDDVISHGQNEGLVLVFLHFCAPQDSTVKPDKENIGLLLQSGFLFQYGGYHCRMVLHPIPHNQSSGIASLKAQGFSTVSDQHEFMIFDLDALDSLPFHPFAALRQTNKPQLGLSHAEKDLLLGALWGNTDAYIANELHISVETVRKRWRSIFNRFDEQPQVNIFTDSNASRTNRRGSEKRTQVLKYLESHLEEIRP